MEADHVLNSLMEDDVNVQSGGKKGEIKIESAEKQMALLLHTRVQLCC